MRKGCTLIYNKIWSKYSQWWRFSESKPVPCTNSFRKKRLSILVSCMANLSKFHVVFSSSTLIHLDKDAFEVHLCQTVNNFVKQNESSLLWERGVHPNTSSISETLEYLEYLLLTNLTARRCTLSIFFTVIFLVRVPNSGAILNKGANQRKVSSFA